MIKMLVLIAAIVIIGILLIVKGGELLGSLSGIIAIALGVLSLIFWGFWATLIIFLAIACWWWLDNN